MISILPTTNYNTNFKAAPPYIHLGNEIAAIVEGEKITPKAVNNGIPHINSRLSRLAKISTLPLIGIVANYFINRKIKANALKQDSVGDTLAMRLLSNSEKESFKTFVNKYPDVLLIRNKYGTSCLETAACWNSDSSLVNFIAEKLVSNPNYNPNKKCKPKRGNTPCYSTVKGDTDAHILVRKMQLDALKIIASHPKINLSICNNKGKTPIDVAMNLNVTGKNLEMKNEIIEFLLSKI